MLAIVADETGEPEVLRLTEVEKPAAAAGELLIRVAAVGINRADLMQRQGHYPPPPGASDILGLECSGEIAAVGSGVTGWEVGDACVALLAGGGYAEYVAVAAGQVIEPPDGIDRVTAAGLVEVAATVTSNLDIARLRSGETLLVHGGAGGVGSFAIQYAKVVGATVIATAGSADKLDYCRSRGADLALSYRDDWAARVRELTGEHGVDVVLDPIGAKYLDAHVSLLAVEGRVMMIGMQGGRKAELDIGSLIGKRGRLVATTIRSRPVAEKAEICARVAATVWPLITTRQIKPAPQTVLPLGQAAEAHRRLESGDSAGKFILTVPSP